MIDGHSAMGMVTSSKAMETAIGKAGTSGIGYVGVSGGTHFGAAGYYASMALKGDLIGLAMSNADPNMNVPGGRGGIIGNNPIAFAAPAGKEKPILMDIALSSVAAAKVWSAKAQGKAIPDTWVADGDGLPTTDTSVWPSPGSLLPMAAHKGYALALMVEVLAAVCAGSGVLKEVTSWSLKPHLRTNTGHAFVAVDIGAMMPIDDFKRRMDDTIREIKESPKAKGSERIYLPGEMEWERREEALKLGIEFPEAVMRNLIGVGQDQGLEFGQFLR
jgi:LDH2 family malate/lactate/ureidoglycolate dehydrogenase